MVGAFGNNPPGDWALPNNPVIWQPFHGQYEFFGAPSTSSESTDTKKHNNHAAHDDRGAAHDDRAAADDD